VPALSHSHTRKGKSRTYRIWCGIKQRVLNTNDPRYSDYGGAGVKLYVRWHKFENFLQDMGEAPPDKSIDRYPDPAGSYEPSNCRWATAKEQQNNRRTTVRLTFQGETLTIPQWADRVKIGADALRGRLRSGWSVEQALTVPVEKKRPKPNCQRGHPMRGNNIYLRPDNGKRACRTCRNKNSKVHNRRRDARTRDARTNAR